MRFLLVMMCFLRGYFSASSNSTLREAKVYLDPLGCTKFPEDKTTSVCFKFSSGKFYTKNVRF